MRSNQGRSVKVEFQSEQPLSSNDKKGNGQMIRRAMVRAFLSSSDGRAASGCASSQLLALDPLTTVIGDRDTEALSQKNSSRGLNL